MQPIRFNCRGLLLVVALSAGCQGVFELHGSEDEPASAKPGPDGIDPNDPDGAATHGGAGADNDDGRVAKGVCDPATTYIGFGDTVLSAGPRSDTPGIDRGRVKPFEVLGSEYRRVLGVQPQSLDRNASTFGAAPARWFEEPRSSAVALFSLYQMGFDAALQYVEGRAEFGAVPTEASAESTCRDLQRRAFQRVPTDADVAHCVRFAVDDTRGEDSAERRWAYTFASVLSSSGFLTY